MNNLNWLVRASQWVRNPPSEKRVILVLVVVGLGLAIAGLEHFGLWPEWAKLERAPRGGQIPR